MKSRGVVSVIVTVSSFRIIRNGVRRLQGAVLTPLDLLLGAGEWRRNPLSSLDPFSPPPIRHANNRHTTGMTPAYHHYDEL